MKEETKSTFARQKELHRRAYMRWNDKDNEELFNMFQDGKSVKEMAIALKRNDGAIRSRLRKYGFGL